MEDATGVVDSGGGESGWGGGLGGGVGWFGVGSLEDVGAGGAGGEFGTFFFGLGGVVVGGLVWVGRGFFGDGGGGVDFFFALVRGAGFGLGVGEGAGYDVGEPVTQTTGRGVDGGMGRVDGYAFEGEAEEGLLLCVCEGQGFEALEDYGVCDSRCVNFGLVAGQGSRLKYGMRRPRSLCAQSLRPRRLW